jgi:hypothetical protein
MGGVPEHWQRYSLLPVFQIQSHLKAFSDALDLFILERCKPRRAPYARNRAHLQNGQASVRMDSPGMDQKICDVVDIEGSRRGLGRLG